MPAHLDSAQAYVNALRTGDFITFLDITGFVSRKYQPRLFGNDSKMIITDEDLVPLLIKELATTDINESDFKKLNLFFQVCVEGNDALLHDSALIHSYIACAPQIFALLVERKQIVGAFYSPTEINSKADLESYQNRPEFDKEEYAQLIVQTRIDYDDDTGKELLIDSPMITDAQQTQVDTYWLDNLYEVKDRFKDSLTAEERDLLDHVEEDKKEFKSDAFLIFKNWLAYQESFTEKNKKFSFEQCTTLAKNFPETNLFEHKYLTKIPKDSRQTYINAVWEVAKKEDPKPDYIKKIEKSLTIDKAPDYADLSLYQDLTYIKANHPELHPITRLAKTFLKNVNTSFLEIDNKLLETSEVLPKFMRKLERESHKKFDTQLKALENTLETATPATQKNVRRVIDNAKVTKDASNFPMDILILSDVLKETREIINSANENTHQKKKYSEDLLEYVAVIPKTNRLMESMYKLARGISEMFTKGTSPFKFFHKKPLTQSMRDITKPSPKDRS